MATEQLVRNHILSKIAGEDLTAHQYRAVTLDSSGEVVACTAGAPALGILQNAPDEDEVAEVAIGGESKVEAGGVWALTAGLVLLTPGAAGKIVEAGTGDVVCAVASVASGADAEITSAVIRPQHEPIT